MAHQARHGRAAHPRVRVGEGKSFFPPRLPRPDGGGRQAVRGQQRDQSVPIHQARVADRELDAVVAPFGDPRHIGGQVALQGRRRELCCLRG